MTTDLTDDMIRQLAIEAGAAGDIETVKICHQALFADEPFRQWGRIEVAEMINEARAMDDSRCRVEVVP